MYIVPRELTGQIKPHGAADEWTQWDERGTAGEESERISWPTQKPTLLMTLSAVISGCYLSWLPGAHLLRITNLHTLLLSAATSLFLAFLPSRSTPFPHPVCSSLRHQDHGIRGSL